MSRVYIDGASGTVGMALHPYLARLEREELITSLTRLAPGTARDVSLRATAMEDAEIVVLCLPDDVAVQAARMAQAVNPDIRILDASAAHRCHPDWVYGLPEVTPAGQIREAKLVANPGCLATGCILLARPLKALLDEWVPAVPGTSGQKQPWVAFQGCTGYSAGGSKATPDPEAMPYMTQVGVAHRHLPEIERYGAVSPALTTIVGDWAKGMLVQTTLPVDADEVVAAYLEAYGPQGPIQVCEAHSGVRRLSAQCCNDRVGARIIVGRQPYGCTAAIAYDNLGKGSAGTAAHNLRLMLGGRDD